MKKCILRAGAAFALFAAAAMADTVTGIHISADQLNPPMSEADFAAVGKLRMASPALADAALHIASECGVVPSRNNIRAMGKTLSFTDAVLASSDHRSLPVPSSQDCHLIRVASDDE
jgi:hypothetical protein